MTLCAILGSGPVGEYVAAHIREKSPDVRIIGLTATRPWLTGTAVGFVYTLRFAKCLALLKKHNATEVIFAGNPYDSLTAAPDALAIRHMFLQRSFWIPHSYLRGIQRLLSEENIAIRSVLEFLPSMAAEDGLSMGDCHDYGPTTDLREALRHVNSQPFRSIRQASIVSGGQVVMAEATGGTDELIRKFGRSAHRGSAAWPVLCKVAVEPFGNIDVPTIGDHTAALCIENGIRAIAVEGNKTILMQRDAVAKLAASGLICLMALSKNRFLNISEQEIMNSNP